MKKLYIAALVLAVAISGAAFAYDSSPTAEFAINATTIYFNWTNGYSSVLNLSLNAGYNYTNVTIPNSTVTSALLYSAEVNSTKNNVTLNATESNSSTFTLSCGMPSGNTAGRYAGGTTIYNSSNPDSANITLSYILDVPAYFNSSRLTAIKGNATSAGERFYFNSTNVSNTVGFEVNLTGTGASAATVILFNSSGSGLGSSTVNSTASFSYVSPTYPLTSGYWYITVSNSSAEGLPFNGTIEAKKPSLIVNDTFQTGTLQKSDNIGYNKTITTGFWINNSADYNLTITSVTNSTNLTDGSGHYITIASNATNGTLENNTAKRFELNFTLNTSLTNNTPGIYRGWIFFNTSNGYPYDTFNLSLALNLTNLLDVNVSDITNHTGYSRWTYSNSTINITVTPRYANGTMVPNLATGNFTATMSHVNSASFGTCDVTLANVTVVTTTPHYNLTAIVPATSSACGEDDAVIGGNYTVSVSVTDKNTNGSNAGSGSLGNLTINDTALRTTMLSDGSAITSVSKSIGGTFDVNPRIFNYGSLAAQEVNVTYSGGSCVNKISGPSVIYIGTVNPGEYKENTTEWTFNATTNGTCTITFTGASPTGAWQDKTATIGVTVSSSGGSTGGTNTNQQQQNQTTEKHELTITEFPSSLQITQGKTGSAAITVKNTGDYTEKVSILIEGISSGWWTAPDSESILKGSSKSFTIEFNIPENADVKAYSIKYKASSSSTSATSDATLKVMPSNSTQTMILQNLTNLTKSLEDLEKQINASRDAGYNTSAAESHLSTAKDRLKQAKGYADANDWFNSYNLLDDVRSALDNAQAALAEAQKKPAAMPFSASLIAAGVAAAAIIGAIIYLLLPAGGKSAGGYSFGAHPMGKTNAHVLKGKLSEKLKKLREKFKRKKTARSSSPSGYHYSYGS
ncbi:MAG: hypothetical protein QXU82_01020 [Candidatus Aenigmatarchaeota archaeon]